MLYTLINVPYGALNASLTRDTNEITTLTSVRMFLANTGGLAVAYGIPKLVACLSPDGLTNTAASADAWFATMTIYGIVGLLLLVFCFTQCKERVVMDAKERRMCRCPIFGQSFVVIARYVFWPFSLSRLSL